MPGDSHSRRLNTQLNVHLGCGPFNGLPGDDRGDGYHRAMSAGPGRFDGGAHPWNCQDRVNAYPGVGWAEDDQVCLVYVL